MWILLIVALVAGACGQAPINTDTNQERCAYGVLSDSSEFAGTYDGTRWNRGMMSSDSGTFTPVEAFFHPRVGFGGHAAISFWARSDFEWVWKPATLTKDAGCFLVRK